MPWAPQDRAILMLKDGTVWEGIAVGKIGMAGGELCFNTGMTGYQEVFTDPSYAGQILIMTAPHIGNYGIRRSESQSDHIHPTGIVLAHFSPDYSRALGEMSLDEYFIEHQVVGIAEVDTRALVRHIREKGAMNAVIVSGDVDLQKAHHHLQNIPPMKGLALAEQVSTPRPYCIGNPHARWRVAVLDLGVKRNILHSLERHDCYVQVFPAHTSMESITAWNPHGFLLSNGPGDPEPLTHAIALTRNILASGMPVMGICLGHQLIARAMGVKTYKMHIGHRGLNHPVQDLRTGRSVITSQNHGFGVSEADVAQHPHLRATFINLNDGTIEGMEVVNRPVLSVQFHPEAAPGPHDTLYLFEEFIRQMSEYHA